jgi:hypothetical protein
MSHAFLGEAAWEIAALNGSLALPVQSFGTGTSLTGVIVLVHRSNPGQRNL